MELFNLKLYSTDITSYGGMHFPRFPMKFLFSFEIEILSQVTSIPPKVPGISAFLKNNGQSQRPTQQVEKFNLYAKTTHPTILGGKMTNL